MNFLLCALSVTSFFILVQGQLTNEQKTKFAEYNKECMTTSGVSKETLLKVKKGVFENDPKLKKYLGCMMRKIGIQTSDGKIQTSVIQAKLPKDIKPEELKKVVAACKDTKGSNPDETAFMIYKCYWEATPNHISFGM